MYRVVAPLGMRAAARRVGVIRFGVSGVLLSVGPPFSMAFISTDTLSGNANVAFCCVSTVLTICSIISH